MRPTAPMFPRSTRRSSILSQPSGRKSEPLLKNATVVLVMLALAVSLWHRRPNTGEPVTPGPGNPNPDSERRAGIAVGTATAATVLTILGLTLASYIVTRGLNAVPLEPLTIRVRGYQWW